MRQRRAGNAMPSIDSTAAVAFSQPTLEGPQPSQYWQGMDVSSLSLRRDIGPTFSYAEAWTALVVRTLFTGGRPPLPDLRPTWIT